MMNNSFFNLPMEERKLLITKTADRLDVSDLVIEKDLWVCWVLEQLFSLPVHMAFKGGTSLSKAFGLIKRFSEDCDITLDYRHFMPELVLEGMSRSQLKKVSEQLKKQLQKYVSETVLPWLQDRIAITFPGQQFKLSLSEDGEQLRFYYTSIVCQSPGYLRDHVLIEFGIRNSTEPCNKHAIVPYLGSVVDERIHLPVPSVDTLSPVRTFWEKVTLIHVECNRDRLAQTPERLSRHWYDLYMLNNSPFGKESIMRDDIFRSVLEYKKAFFNASYANYDDCHQGKLKLIPQVENQKILASDFRHMIEAAMFYEEPPVFSEIMDSLKSLENSINAIYAKEV